MTKATNNPLYDTIDALENENQDLRERMARTVGVLANDLKIKDLEIGATRNLLGAVIVAVGGRVRVTQEAVGTSYHLGSEHDEASLMFTFEATPIFDVNSPAGDDVVLSETLPDEADTDTPEHGTDNAPANN